jgi:nitrous oxidase accessory protein NosD
MVACVLSVTLFNSAQAQGGAPANGAPKITAYCSSPGSVDESCLRNALTAVAGKTGAKLVIPAGTYRLGSLVIATSNVTLSCEPGAILQPTESSTGIRVTGNNVVFDGCTIDLENIKSGPGMMVTKASGFALQNGAIIHISEQSGLQLNQTSNAVINKNRFATDGSGDAVFAYGPTANIRITDNHGVGSIDVDSGRNAGGASHGVMFTGNVLQPVKGKTILTTGDFSNGYGPASPITQIVIAGNTCNIVAASAAAAPFGCYSLVSGEGLTFTNNTMNAVGQYVGNSLVEMGTADATMSNNIFRAGNDPGAQTYNDIIIYSTNVQLSNNAFIGTSAHGDAIRIYPESNADDISISGGSVTADNSGGTRPQNDGISVACNENRIPLRVTGIAGGGAKGAVSSVAIVQYPGKNAPVGSGFSRVTGVAATGGSGTGLKLDVLSVDAHGGIASLGVSPGYAGSDYAMGDVVDLPVSGSESAAEAKGVEISGVTISGAFLHAVDIQSFQEASCPVSAELQNVTISGASDATPIAIGVFERSATVKSSAIRFAHVTKATDTDR